MCACSFGRGPWMPLCTLRRGCDVTMGKRMYVIPADVPGAFSSLGFGLLRNRQFDGVGARIACPLILGRGSVRPAATQVLRLRPRRGQAGCGRDDIVAL